MKPLRAPHLRTLNRFSVALPYSNDGRVVHIIVRPRGYNVRLATITVNCHGELDDGRDLRDFLEAVQALANTPAPAPQKRRRRRPGR